jgi:ubiquinone/menaquinone biosynthesis C-methylase UbiE
VAEYLQRWVEPDGELLDLAVGSADFTRAIQTRHKIAIDLNSALVDFVHAHHPSDPDGHSEIETIIADAIDLGSFLDERFTMVFASNFIEHLEHTHIDALLAEIRRVLAPAGHLVLVQLNFRLAPRRYVDDCTHGTIWTDQSLSDLLVAAGFELEHVEAPFLPLSMRSRLSFGHRLVPLYLRLPYRPLAGQMLVVARNPAAATG